MGEQMMRWIDTNHIIEAAAKLWRQRNHETLPAIGRIAIWPEKEFLLYRDVIDRKRARKSDFHGKVRGGQPCQAHHYFKCYGFAEYDAGLRCIDATHSYVRPR